MFEVDNIIVGNHVHLTITFSIIYLNELKYNKASKLKKFTFFYFLKFICSMNLNLKKVKIIK